MQSNKKTRFTVFSSITQMNDIKQYKPLALVFYIDGNGNRNALPLDDSKREEFKRIIENQKMVELEGIIINTFDIKEIRPADKTSELEKFYYSRTYQERSKIAQRVRNRAGNPKVNVLEWLSELWSEKAISLMQWMIKPIVKEVEPPVIKPTVQMTPEEMEEIKSKFKKLLSKYTN